MGVAATFWQREGALTFQGATQPTWGLSGGYVGYVKESGTIPTGSGTDIAPKPPSQTNGDISIAAVDRKIREITPSSARGSLRGGKQANGNKTRKVAIRMAIRSAKSEMNICECAKFE